MQQAVVHILQPEGGRFVAYDSQGPAQGGQGGSSEVGQHDLKTGGFGRGDRVTAMFAVTVVEFNTVGIASKQDRSRGGWTERCG